MAQDRVLSIARDKEHFQIRSDRASGIGNLPSVQPAGKADIGDKQINARSGVKHLQSGCPVLRFEGIVAKIRQDFCYKHADGGFVVDDGSVKPNAPAGKEGRVGA
jgi:hypothetical protein